MLRLGKLKLITPGKYNTYRVGREGRRGVGALVAVSQGSQMV